MSGLDRGADVDGGERSEDERLDGDDDDDLEEVEGDPDRERDHCDDPERDPAEDEEQAEALLRHYSDKRFSYTDATSFVIVRRLGIEAVFTFEGTDSIQSLILGRELTGLPAIAPA